MYQIGNTIYLRSDEIVQLVGRVRTDEAVAHSPGRPENERRRSVSHFDEFTETHLSGTFAMTFNSSTILLLTEKVWLLPSMNQDIVYSSMTELPPATQMDGQQQRPPPRYIRDLLARGQLQTVHTPIIMTGKHNTQETISR